MRVLRCLRLAVGCASFLLLLPRAILAEDVTLEQLIAKVPSISSADPSCESIELEGQLNLGVNVCVRALYRAPDQFALYVSDTDGTPLAMVSNERLLVYDPVGPVVIVGEGGPIRAKLECSGQKFNCEFGISNKNEEKPALIEFDLKSLYARGEGRDVVDHVVDRMYRIVSSNDDKHALITTIDLSAATPFTRMEVTDCAGDDTIVCVHRIAVNEGLTDSDFAIPTKDELAGKVAVRDLSANGFFNQVTAIALIGRACYARVAAREPSVRDKVKIPGLSNIDWDQVRKNDRQVSQALREAMSPTLRR